jgi:hypothetical protein
MEVTRFFEDFELTTEEGLRKEVKAIAPIVKSLSVVQPQKAEVVYYEIAKDMPSYEQICQMGNKLLNEL